MPTKYDSIIKDAIKLAEPSAKETERIASIARYIMKRVRSACRGRKYSIKPMLAGSYAKGTWVAGDADIDIFAKVPPTLTKEELGRLGIDIGKTALRNHSPYLRYSEHPYVEARVRGTKVNIVACYDVLQGEWRSAADRSPYHTELIREKFDDQMRREARILKRFLKGLGIYGAEIKTRGFSGYVAEVLILKYGTFLNALSNISQLKFGDAIFQSDSDRVYVQLHLTPIIILDPVDPRRNLGAAISKQKVAELILGASLFLERPLINFFGVKKVGNSVKKGVTSNIVVITFTHEERTVDKLWGQLNKSLDHLERHLSDLGFKVLRSLSASDEKNESAFVFLLEGIELSQRKERLGPETSLPADSIRFIATNKDRADQLWIGNDGRIHSLIKRDVSGVRVALAKLLGNAIDSAGLSHGIRNEIRSTKKVFVGKQVQMIVKNRRWLKEAVSEIASTSRIIACCS